MALRLVHPEFPLLRPGPQDRIATLHEAREHAHCVGAVGAGKARGSAKALAHAYWQWRQEQRRNQTEDR